MKIETSIYKLTVDKFITCMCDGDLSPLIIEGEPTQEQLQNAWAVIYDAYVEGISDKEQLHIFRLSKEIKLLETRITKVNFILEILAFRYDESLAAELIKEVGLMAFDKSSDETYKKSISLAATKSKRLVLELNTKCKELEQIAINTPTGSPIDRKYFDELLNRCSQYMNAYLKPAELTVSRLIDIVKDRRETIEKIKDKHHAK